MALCPWVGSCRGEDALHNATKLAIKERFYKAKDEKSILLVEWPCTNCGEPNGNFEDIVHLVDKVETEGEIPYEKKFRVGVERKRIRPDLVFKNKEDTPLFTFEVMVSHVPEEETLDAIDQERLRVFHFLPSWDWLGWFIEEEPPFIGETEVEWLDEDGLVIAPSEMIEGHWPRMTVSRLLTQNVRDNMSCASCREPRQPTSKGPVRATQLEKWLNGSPQKSFMRWKSSRRSKPMNDRTLRMVHDDARKLSGLGFKQHNVSKPWLFVKYYPDEDHPEWRLYADLGGGKDMHSRTNYSPVLCMYPTPDEKILWEVRLLLQRHGIYPRGEETYPLQKKRSWPRFPTGLMGLTY